MGAQPSTVKKSPDTVRRTNPLMPEYQLPGRLDLENKNDGYSNIKLKKTGGESTFKNAAQ